MPDQTKFNGRPKPRKHPKVDWVESPSTLPTLSPKPGELVIEGIPSWKNIQILSNPESDFESLVKRHLILKQQFNTVEGELKEVRGPLQMYLELAMAELGMKKTDLSKEKKLQFSVADVVVSMEKRENKKLNIDLLQKHLMVAGLDADVVAKCFQLATKDDPTYYPVVRKTRKKQVEGEVIVGEVIEEGSWCD